MSYTVCPKNGNWILILWPPAIFLTPQLFLTSWPKCWPPWQNKVTIPQRHISITCRCFRLCFWLKCFPTQKTGIFGQFGRYELLLFWVWLAHWTQISTLFSFFLQFFLSCPVNVCTLKHQHKLSGVLASLQSAHIPQSPIQNRFPPNPNWERDVF